MKNIDSELNRRLKSSVQSLCSDRARDILSESVQPARGDEWYLKPARSKRRTLAALVPIAACLIAAVGLFALARPQKSVTADVRSKVYIDINPSIELRLDGSNKVLEAKAGNSDGETVLSGMKLEGIDVRTAANAIIGSTISHGFLSRDKDIVLVSVESRDKSNSDSLKQELLTEMNSSLKKNLGSGTVLEQDVSEDGEVQALAEEKNISVGKAYLIKRIVSLYPKLSEDTLCGLSVKEITRYLKDNGVNIREFVELIGDDPDDVVEDVNEEFYGDDDIDEEDDDDDDQDDGDEDDDDEDDDDEDDDKDDVKN